MSISKPFLEPLFFPFWLLVYFSLCAKLTAISLLFLTSSFLHHLCISREGKKYGASQSFALSNVTCQIDKWCKILCANYMGPRARITVIADKMEKKATGKFLKKKIPWQQQSLEYWSNMCIALEKWWSSVTASPQLIQLTWKGPLFDSLAQQFCNLSYW